MIESAVWIAAAVLLSLPAMFYFAERCLPFFVKGIASSLISFGGGDAYLTIADGLFVPDYISENSFYNYLILIVNGRHDSRRHVDGTCRVCDECDGFCGRI